jgi:hypothetical protein
MTIQCRCGYRVEGVEDITSAEVMADVHESSDVRRSYRHGPRKGVAYVGDTLIVADIFWETYKETK